MRGDDHAAAPEAHESPADAALRAAMDRLSRRDWARGELVAALVTAGFDAAEAEAAVARCVARGWLDEAAAARHRAERLRRRGPVAPAGIVRDLERRQVDPAVAARIAAEAVPDPVAEAEAAIRREIRRRGAADDPVDALPWPQRRRLAARLARRGFDEETVAQAMRRCGVPVDEPPEDEATGGPVDLYD